MHHIVFASHAWHLHHCAFLSYQLMVPEAEQQIYADRPTAFLFLNMAITGWPWPRGFPTYSYRFMVRKMLYCNLWGFFDVVRILAESFDDSRKPSKTAAAWSFRRAFHSAPKSFLTFWIVYAQAGTHATLTSSRGGKSIGPSTVVCQTRNLNQGQSSCQEAEGQGQKILGMPIRNHVSPTGGMRNRYSVIANWIESFGSGFVWWETWGMLSFWRSQTAFRVTFCQGWIWCKRKNGLVALHSSSITGWTNMWICSPPLV